VETSPLSAGWWRLNLQAIEAPEREQILERNVITVAAAFPARAVSVAGGGSPLIPALPARCASDQSVAARGKRSKRLARTPRRGSGERYDWRGRSVPLSSRGEARMGREDAKAFRPSCMRCHTASIDR